MTTPSPPVPRSIDPPSPGGSVEVGAPPPISPPASGRALLWRALRTRRRDLIAASILYSTHQLGESMVPVIIGATISQAVDHGSRASIASWLGVLAADFVFLSLSYRFGARASTRARQHVGHWVRMRLTDRAVLPAGGIDHAPGDLLSRASSDAGRVGAYAGVFAFTIAAATVLITSTVLLLRLSFMLGVIILAGTIVLLIVQSRVSRLLRSRSFAEQYEQARATVLAEDLIRGLRVLKGIGAGRNAAAEYRKASQSAATASLHAVSSEATLLSVGQVLTGLYLMAIAGVGGWLALHGDLGLGQLVSALGLGRFVIGPMRAVSGAHAAYARALASAERIRVVLAAEPAVLERTTPYGDGAEPGRGELRFDEVTLSPTAQITATVPAGSMTALVCRDPVVAARIPRLLARDLAPAGGEILLDGIPTNQISLNTLRRAVLVCHHDAVLLPGSIADNLAALAATGHEMAARAANADQVIATVPYGAATPVGDRGETLSGGQRQRIALARALAADSTVLVLHEPTTAVDAATEDSIAENVRALRYGRTTLVITTNPAWLSRCEQVLFLPGGRGGAWVQGRHAALLSNNAAYREAVTR